MDVLLLIILGLLSLFLARPVGAHVRRAYRRRVIRRRLMHVCRRAL